MEVNKDEAQRCLSISRTHYDSGNLASAVKFAKKSIALYSTPTAVAFLAKLNKEQEQSSTDEPSASAGSSSGFGTSNARTTGAETRSTAGSSTTHRTTANGSTNGSAKPEQPKREYTPDQAKIVKRIRACKVTAYYEILGLSKECEENDVKKGYRKVCQTRILASRPLTVIHLMLVGASTTSR